MSQKLTQFDPWPSVKEMPRGVVIAGGFDLELLRATTDHLLQDAELENPLSIHALALQGSVIQPGNPARAEVGQAADIILKPTHLVSAVSYNVRRILGDGTYSSAQSECKLQLRGAAYIKFATGEDRVKSILWPADLMMTHQEAESEDQAYFMLQSRV